MKTLHLICFILIFTATSANAQAKKESAFKLQLDVADDKWFAKGWFYQVASKIMHDHEELFFVENDNEASRLKTAVPVRLSQDARLSSLYFVQVGNLQSDGIPVRVNSAGIDRAARSIASALMKLHNKELPKTMIDLCYEAIDSGTDIKKFNFDLKNCLNESSFISDIGNYSFDNSCQKQKNKFLITGKLISKAAPSRANYIEHQMEIPSLDIVISLLKVNFSADRSQWEAARVCADSRRDISTLLSLSPNLLIKLSRAQNGDRHAAFKLTDTLIQREKMDAALFLLSSLKEKAELSKTENPVLAEICVKRAQAYLLNNDNYNAGNDFQMAMKADKNNVAAAVGYANVLIGTSRTKEARSVLNNVASIASNDPEYNLAQGELSLLSGTTQETDNAITSFKKLLNSESYRVIACEKLAKIFDDQGNKQEAIRYYKLAIKKDLAISNQLAALYSQMASNTQDSTKIKYYDSAIQFDKSNAEYYYSRGYSLMQQGQADSAIESFKLSIENDPNEVRYFALGYAYHFKGLKDDAIENYSKALEINPKYVLALNNRSILYRLKKNYKKALQDIDKAIEVDPNYALASYNKGQVLQDSGEYRLAVNSYSTSIRLDPDFTDNYFDRGSSYYFLHNYSEAENDFDHYISHSNDHVIDSIAFYYKGVSEYRNTEYDAALKDLTTYLKYERNSFWSYYYLANTYRSLAKANEKDAPAYLEKAKQNYIKAIAINRANLDTYFELGLLSDDLKDFKGAVEWARKGTHVADSLRRTNFPELFGNLGWYLYELKEFSEALKVSKDALKKDENLLYVRFNLGLISLCMGRVEQAKDYYDDAISSLIKGKHYDGDTANKMNMLDELGLVDLRNLQKESRGEVAVNATKMIEYLAIQKDRLK